jgi:hypothetical protein
MEVNGNCSVGKVSVRASEADMRRLRNRLVQPQNLLDILTLYARPKWSYRASVEKLSIMKKG